MEEFKTGTTKKVFKVPASEETATAPEQITQEDSHANFSEAGRNPGFTVVDVDTQAVQVYSREYTPEFNTVDCVADIDMLLRYMVSVERKNNVTMSFQAYGVDPIVFNKAVPADRPEGDPACVMIPVAGILVFLLVKGRLRTVGRYLGWRFWLVLLVLCGAWFGCVYAEGGRAYLDNLLFNQTVNRAVDSFSHKKGFFFYFETFGIAFAPWCLLYVVMLVAGLWKRWVRTDVERFFLTVFCTSLVMLSCISAKLEIYLLPAYPFLAYFSVMMLQRLEDGRRWSRWYSVPVLLPALVLVLSLPAVWVLARRVDSLAMLDAVPVYAGAAVMLLAGVYALFVLYRQKSLAKAVCTVATGLLCGVFVVSFFVPGINSEIGYGNLAGKGAELAEKYGIGRYYSYDVKRASGMEVYLGKDVEETTWEELQSALSGGERAIVFVRNRSLRNQEPLRELLDGKEQHAVGRYTVVVW